MSVSTEISALEERLRLAELGPDPTVFEELLDDNVVLFDQRGTRITKRQVVKAHCAGAAPKFTAVTMHDLIIFEHGKDAAVVSCKGEYESDRVKFFLTFLRFWLKKNRAWRIVAAAIYQS